MPYLNSLYFLFKRQHTDYFTELINYKMNGKALYAHAMKVDGKVGVYFHLFLSSQLHAIAG